MTRCLLLLLLVNAAPHVLAAPIDFDTQVMPLLSRYGCNAAACHGGAAGRGGLKLSLFGGDPDLDYRALVYEREGRRVDLVNPQQSLLVAKPAGLVAHGGDTRFEYDSPEAKLLIEWIAQGAERLRARRLARLDVTPSATTVDSLPHALQLKVTAHFDDGLSRDVTAHALYSSNDEGSLTIDEAGKGQVLRPGRHTLVVRYLHETIAVQVTAPYGERRSRDRKLADNFIDQEIERTLDELQLVEGATCDDATFLRRVTLDLVGRLPTVEEIETFLWDETPHKRTARVDQLLASEEFNLFWRFRLGKWLRLRMPGGDRAAAEAIFAWLEGQVRDDAPWDVTARALLESTGDTHRVGPAAFHRLAGDARLEAELVSEALMGVRLRCANCHNHPLDRWTQEDYHGLAAIFAPLERGQVVKLNPLARVINPRTGSDALPQLPGGGALPQGDELRTQLADWLTDTDNPYFRRAFVGRVWHSLMGRGLVEPVDDLRATNPPSHPQLLKRLEDSFADEGYRLRPLLRQIVTSQAYQRVEAPHDMPPNRFYTHATRRPLEAEVAIDAIAQVTGVAETFANHPAGTRAIELIDPLVPSPSLDVLGRCDRTSGCTEGEGGSAEGLAERLHLLNGPLLNARLQDPQGTLAKLVAEGKTTSEIVEHFYLSALGRYPEQEERAWWEERLDATADRGEGLEDFVWSLLNSSEFLSNH